MSNFDDFEDDNNDNNYDNNNNEYEDNKPQLTEKEYTLIFLRRYYEGNKQILLGMKKRGFGAGKWNGFGGKLEENESNEVGAKRELLEESSIIANELTRVGFLVFNMMDTNKLMKVHVYESWNYSGEPQESEEMRPRWFLESEIPFTQMWPDDIHWLPLVLEGNKILGRFDYSDEDTIEDFTVRIQ